jgi:hypothetical protein
MTERSVRRLELASITVQGNESESRLHHLLESSPSLLRSSIIIFPVDVFLFNARRHIMWSLYARGVHCGVFLEEFRWGRQLKRLGVAGGRRLGGVCLVKFQLPDCW